jgi:formylglycine-generating enzyme required for sulfatase activity
MALIDRVVFLALDGDPPAALGFRPLTTFEATYATVANTFAPYLAADARTALITDLATFGEIRPVEGLTVAYLMGHAWLEDGRYRTSARRRAAAELLWGEELVDFLHVSLGDGAVLLFVDTCHAAALRRPIEAWPGAGRVAIFASPADDSTLEFPLDGATRFALLLNACLTALRARAPLDTLELVLRMRDEGARPGVLMPQTITYTVQGTPPAFARPGTTNPPTTRRQRTVAIIRAALIAFGAGVAVLIIAGAVYIHGHASVEIVVGDLPRIARALKVDAYLQRPAANESLLLASRPVGNDAVVRLRLPADDILIVFDGQYEDGAPRAVRLHVLLAPGFQWSEKFLRLTLPSAAEVKKHPRMAYVPATGWWRGREKERVQNREPFWIDLWPPTVEDYLRVLQRWSDEGRLPLEGSVLAVAARNRRSIDAVGLAQLPALGKDLGKIFDVLRAEQKPAVRQRNQQEVAEMPRFDTPCPRCPAPMNRSEALLYCESRGLRIPTSEQWELAARGVDGRIYPWGDRFERDRANVIGLPDKGEPYVLKPVDAFPRGQSPFGMFDAVGNAGDWVDTQGGYESTFMGGEFRFDQNDATTFALTPSTHVPPVYSITTRCVDRS